MRDIDDLRRGLAAETADVTFHVSADVIRRRARGIRIRQATTIAGAAALAVAALAVPTVLLVDGASPASDDAAQVPSASGCPPRPTNDPDSATRSLGPLVETGAILDAPNVNTRYDVLFGLTGTRDQPAFVIAFRDRQRGTVRTWDTTGLLRDPNGDVAGKQAGDPTHRFQSSQLALGPNSVLDVGLYSRTAHRITVESEGHAKDAETTPNAATGWTLFWVRRDAAPLPPDHASSAEEYRGPEQVKLTAYDAAGRPENTVTSGTFVGHYVQNPRDDWPAEEAAPTAEAHCPAAR